MNIIIKAEFRPGEDISNACHEICALSRKLDCYVEANFNGVLLIARPATNPVVLEKSYHEKIQSREHTKIATG